MTLTETNLKWVRGNTLNLAVPLQVVTAANGAQTKVDYTPPTGSEIRVYLVGRHGSREYEPTLSGNVVSFTDNGSLALGDYGLEITIKEPSARNLRAFKCCAIRIVNSSDELGEMPDGQVMLDAALFFQVGSGGGSGAVDSVNGKTGEVTLNAEDVGALPANTPIPGEQMQADWNQTDQTKKDFIKNKPTIPTIPQNLSSFNNDTNFITKAVNDLVNYYLKSEVFSKAEVTALLNALSPGAGIPSGASVDYIVDVEEDGLYFVDEEGNIGAQLTDEGFKAVGTVSVCDNVPRPERIVMLEFFTDDTLPTQKNDQNPILAYGRIKANFDGLEIYKYASLEVQGASSAGYPKKNWTFAFFNDAEYSDEYEFRIGTLVPHSEYVFKANWIDATHCRNIVCNRLWEQFVQSRDGYPKRETEFVYDETATDVNKRIDTGALGHVEGFPCVLYINGAFYGIGDFNIGKKRGNYNLNKSTQTQIQMQAEKHVNFLSYTANEWEIRNPKSPDGNFTSRIAPWFASNDPTDADFKTNFPTTHNLQNAIDYLIFIEFIYADDCVDKNFQLTTWDGEVFSFMPYDLDTTFNLWWDGSKYTDPSDPSVVHSTNNVTQSAMNFWDGFLTAYNTEIVARYNDLKAKGIISVDNIYNLCTELSRKYGKDLYQQEYAKWSTVPSNTNIHTSVPQILDWCEDRIAWMDTHFSNNN